MRTRGDQRMEGWKAWAWRKDKLAGGGGEALAWLLRSVKRTGIQFLVPTW